MIEENNKFIEEQGLFEEGLDLDFWFFASILIHFGFFVFISSVFCFCKCVLMVGFLVIKVDMHMNYWWCNFSNQPQGICVGIFLQ